MWCGVLPWETSWSQWSSRDIFSSSVPSEFRIEKAFWISSHFEDILPSKEKKYSPVDSPVENYFG